MMAWRLGRAIMQCVLLGLQRERDQSRWGAGSRGWRALGEFPGVG